MKRETVEAILAMMPIASTDPTRWNIMGVCVESAAGKVTLTATQGHMLMSRVFEDTLPDGAYFVSRDIEKPLKTLAKDYKRFDEIPHEGGEKGIALQGFGSTVSLKSIKRSDYPDYQQVIPADRPRVAVTLNAEYLAALAKAMKRDGMGAMNVTLAFDPESLSSPIMVYGADDITAVVMPVRADKSKTLTAEWLDRNEDKTLGVVCNHPTAQGGCDHCSVNGGAA